MMNLLLAGLLLAQWFGGSPSYEGENPWTIYLHFRGVSFGAGAEDSTKFETFFEGEMPIVVELLRVEDGGSHFMIGNVAMEEKGQHLVMTMAMDDSVSVHYPNDATMLTTVGRTGKFRVVVSPSPMFWSPAPPDSVELLGGNTEIPPQPFEIRASLFLFPAHSTSFWSFPPDYTSESIVFTHVHGPEMTVPLGFSAAVDVTVDQGQIVGTPVLRIDADADGKPETEIEGKWIER